MDAVFNKKLKELAKDGKDETHSADSFTPEQEAEIIKSFDTDTPMGLLSYVYYHICKFCAARGGYAYDMMWGHLTSMKDESNQDYFKIFIPIEKNNQRGRQAGAARECLIPPREYCIPYINKYLRKRPEGACEFMFLAIQSQKMVGEGLWYKKSRMGKATLESFIKITAKKLNFKPGKYVAHSIRATVATTFYEKDINNKSTMAVTGHRSEAGLRQYQRVTHTKKIEIAQEIMNISGKKTLRLRRTTSVSSTSNATIFKNCTIITKDSSKLQGGIYENCEITFQ